MVGDPDAGMEPPDDALPSLDSRAPDAAPMPPDAAPVACTSAAECDDDLACTTDACEDNVCVHRPDDSACSDEVSCTITRCDVALGCVAAPDDGACDDGVACTADRCDVVEGCVVAPDDSACNDGIACTTNRCDVALGCRFTPSDGACNDGIGCTADRCDAAQGCVATPNDALCNDDDSCTVDSCNSATGCDNDQSPFCSSTCTAVLIYNDSAQNDLALRAATALGLTANVTINEAAFAAAFDAGGFDLIVVDSASVGIPAGVTSRLTSWVQGSGKVVFSHWDLDANAALKSLLGVNTVRELNPAPPVHANPGSPVNFFTLVDVFPSPLVFGDQAGDNGDALTLAGGGFVAASFASATNPEGAILVTRSNRVIVHGFLFHDVFFSNVDADSDSIPDGQELYRNEMRFLCAPQL